MPDKSTEWLLRGISPATRRYVEIYKAEYGITIAEAVNELVQAAFKLHEEQKTQAIESIEK